MKSDADDDDGAREIGQPPRQRVESRPAPRYMPHTLGDHHAGGEECQRQVDAEAEHQDDAESEFLQLKAEQLHRHRRGQVREHQPHHCVQAPRRRRAGARRARRRTLPEATREHGERGADRAGRDQVPRAMQPLPRLRPEHHARSAQAATGTGGASLDQGFRGRQGDCARTSCITMTVGWSKQAEGGEQDCHKTPT
jgi:hypothetical protein